MYESPISMTYSRMIQQTNDRMEDSILKAVMKVGIHVNRDELLKALAYDRNQYEKGFEDGKAEAAKWISVKDGLPVNPGEVLVVLYGRVCIAWYHGGEQFETGSGLICYTEEVSHWMPLPEPPKEDAE